MNNSLQMQSLYNQSHLTAISRKSLPAPVKWIVNNSFIPFTNTTKVLDFGCGKCVSINPSNWDSYDPHYQPDGIKHKKYDIILCTYVLCVLPRSERHSVLRQIQLLLKKSGIAFISVRNDRPRQGWGFSKRNTYQGRATNLPIHEYHSTSQFKIYLLTRHDILD